MRTTHLVTIQLGNFKPLEQLYSIYSSLLFGVEIGWNPLFPLKSFLQEKQSVVLIGTNTCFWAGQTKSGIPIPVFMGDGISAA